MLRKKWYLHVYIQIGMRDVAFLLKYIYKAIFGAVFSFCFCIIQILVKINKKLQ